MNECAPQYSATDHNAMQFNAVVHKMQKTFFWNDDDDDESKGRAVAAIKMMMMMYVESRNSYTHTLTTHSLKEKPKDMMNKRRRERLELENNIQHFFFIAQIYRMQKWFMRLQSSSYESKTDRTGLD